MADERLRIDTTEAVRDIARLTDGLTGLQASAKKAGAAFNDAFSADEAQGVADALDDLQRQYDSLKKSADTLKTALKNATNPELIKLYASNIAKLEAGMHKLEQTGKAAGVNLQKVNGAMTTGKEVVQNYIGAFTKATIIIAAIDAVLKFGAEAINLANQTAKAQKQFEAFTGSADSASKILQELKGFANEKVLPSDDVFQAGKALLAFGEEADNIVPVLGRIADVSRATGKDFNELTTIYGKARAAGVLYAEDINQLVDAGVPIIQEFAKQMGVSNDQVKKLASEGKISFEELQLALFNLTAEGGKFAGQAEAGVSAGDRFSVAWSTALEKVGTVLKPAWDAILNGLAGILDSVSKLAESNSFSQFLENSARAVLKVSPILGQVAKFFNVLQDEEKQGAFFDIPDNNAEAKKVADERLKIEQEAEKKRKERAKANAAELAKIEKEKNALRIQAMKDGEAKEIAQENLRFSELKKQLEKYNLDTTEATEHHEENLLKIQAKYFLERFNEQQDEIERQKELEQELIDFDNEKAAERIANAKKKAEDIFNVRESELDLLEQQYANYLAQMRKDGADEKAIGEQQLKFDNAIAAERLKNKIALQEAILKTLDAGNTAEIEIVKNNIATLKAQLEGLSIDVPTPDGGKGDGKGLLESFGFNDDQIAELRKGADSLISIINDVSAAQIEKADRAIDAANREKDAAKSFYDEQKALNEQGFANDLDLAERRLQAAAAQEQRALEQKKKAQRQQILIESALQAANIATSASQAFKAFPPPLTPIAIGLVGLMIGAFVAAKARALQATKFRKGGEGYVDGRGVIVGGSHESGGVAFEAEGGEFWGSDGKRFGIVNKRMTAKHFDLLQAINRDDRDKMREALSNLVAPIDRDRVIGAAGGSVALVVGKDRDTYNLLKDWKNKSGKRKTVTVANGYIIEQEGNATRKIKMR